MQLVDRSAANVKKAALGSGPMTLRHARARHPRTRGFTKPILHRVRQERTPGGSKSSRGKGGLDIKKGDTQREMAVDVADP